MAVDLVISDLTNGSLDVNNEWAGTGIFDKLIAAVNKNIEGQYNLGRITTTDFATVYLGSMQSVIAESMQFLLQEKAVEAQIDLTREKLDTELINQQAVIASARDQYGREIDALGNDTIVSDPTLNHTKDIEAKGYENSVKAEAVPQAKAKTTLDAVSVEAEKIKVEREYGKVVSVTAPTTTGDVPTVTTKEAGYDSASSKVLRYDDKGALLADTAGTNVGIAPDGGIPLSTWEASMKKANKEEAVGKASVIGYEADSYYKQYKSLQEILFGLANANVIDKADATNTNSVYSKILASMEYLMNNQTIKWSTSTTGFVDLTSTTLTAATAADPTGIASKPV